MTHSKASLIFGLLFGAAVCAPSQKQSETPEHKPVQSASAGAADVHEMLFTEAGLLAFDTPKDWERSDGPGFACFVPKGSDVATSPAIIYISGAVIGPDQQDKTLNDYVRSDISGFKSRFKKGEVHREQPMFLPVTKMEVPVYTFRSGQQNNAVEQVAYVQDTDQRVLTVVLSAKTDIAFSKSLAAFQNFVKSFRGSIVQSSGHTDK